MLREENIYFKEQKAESRDNPATLLL